MKSAYSVIREWIQWNAINGSSVIWGSEDRLKLSRDLTVKDFENIAKDIQDSHEEEVNILKVEKQTKQICIDNLKDQLKKMDEAFYEIDNLWGGTTVKDLLSINRIIEPFLKEKHC